MTAITAATARGSGSKLHRKEQMRCPENRVARIMRVNGIVAIQKRKLRVTTNSKHDHPAWPNVLNRNFVIEKPNSAWVSDITYVWTLEGRPYVATGLDLFSRGIVGWAMDKTIADTLTTQAMQQAILRRNPTKGLICHSDRGKPVCRQ